MGGDVCGWGGGVNIFFSGPKTPTKNQKEREKKKKNEKKKRRKAAN